MIPSLLLHCGLHGQLRSMKMLYCERSLVPQKVTSSSRHISARKGSGVSARRRGARNSLMAKPSASGSCVWPDLSPRLWAQGDDSPGLLRGSVWGAPAWTRLFSGRDEGWWSFVKRRSAQGYPLGGQQAVNRREGVTHVHSHGHLLPSH